MLYLAERAAAETANGGGQQCWGAILKGDEGRGCDPAFMRGRRHMKNKFCNHCNGKRGDLYLPATRVRGLPESMHGFLVNSSEGGVWSVAPAALGSARFRVINNTAGCCMPRLIIFEQAPPALQWGYQWADLPSDWISGNFVHLYVSRGTLVPSADRKKRPAPPPTLPHGIPSLPGGSLVAPSAHMSTEPPATVLSYHHPPPASQPYTPSGAPVQAPPPVYGHHPHQPYSVTPGGHPAHPGHHGHTGHPSHPPPHPSTLPPHPSTLPPHPSTLPPHPSTLPPHPAGYGHYAQSHHAHMARMTRLSPRRNCRRRAGSTRVKGDR